MLDHLANTASVHARRALVRRDVQQRPGQIARRRRSFQQVTRLRVITCSGGRSARFLVVRYEQQPCLATRCAVWFGPAEHGDSYFTFMDHDGVDPTNNRTEQKIRFVVIDRKVTQGTKGRIGQLWCERIWSTITTCRQRGRPLFKFLLDTFNAHIRGKLTPSLIYA